MTVSIGNQVYVFLYCIIGGGVIGLLFDFFRLTRKVLRTNDIITYVEDIVFWLMVGVVVLLTIFESNNGQLRGYVFLGIFLGMVLYLMILSKSVMKVLAFIVDFSVKATKTITKIFGKPIKIAIKIVAKPTRFICTIAKKFIRRTILTMRKWIMHIIRSKKIMKEKI